MKNFGGTREQDSQEWRSACEALAEAERSGLPEHELERLADDIIASRLPIPPHAATR